MASERIVSVDDCKLAMRITTTEFDNEIGSLIWAGQSDLEMAGVVFPADTGAVLEIVKIAIITYVKMNFGNPENYDRLKKSYDEQKAQLSMATGYTEWV